MKSPDWRVGGEGPEAKVAPDGVTELSGPGWRGRFERVTFGPGFHIHLGSVETSAAVEIPVIRAGAGPPPISVFAVTGGQAEVTVGGAPPFHLQAGIAMLLNSRDGGGLFRIAPGEVLRFLGVAMSPDLLVDLVGGQVPAPLTRLIHDDGAGPAIFERALSAVTRGMVEDLAEPRGGAGLQRLHREAVALRLVTELVGTAMESGEAPALSPRDVDAIRAARERLLADLREPPAAASLALEAGMGLRRFLRAFEAMHGESPAQLLRRERLTVARHLAESGDLPLKEIAWQIGYGHVSNFVTAFSEQYGEPPRRLARRRRAG